MRHCRARMFVRRTGSRSRLVANSPRHRGSVSMDYMVVISAVVLGLSMLATVAKFLDWVLHSDPRTMVRTTRWMLLLVLLACVPLLIYALSSQQWALSMLLGAGMLIVPTLLKWRTMFAPLIAAFDHFRPRVRPHVGPHPH